MANRKLVGVEMIERMERERRQTDSSRGERYVKDATSELASEFESGFTSKTPKFSCACARARSNSAYDTKHRTRSVITTSITTSASPRQHSSSTMLTMTFGNFSLLTRGTIPKARESNAYASQGARTKRTNA